MWDYLSKLGARSWGPSPRLSQRALARLAVWKRRPGERPKVLGHRGARHAWPENTLLAYQRALDEGADGIEIDVRTTADGALVIAHDDVLSPETHDARGPFAEIEPPRLGQLTASQLESVRLAQGERIPTLREVLEFSRRTGSLVNVELKRDVASRSQLVRDACALLDSFEDVHALVSSFDPFILRAVRARCPDVPVAWLVHAEQRVLKHAPGWRLWGADGVNPESVDLPASRIQELSSAGALINVWTVNEPARARELSALGVDGIITDAPGAILHALQAPS